MREHKNWGVLSSLKTKLHKCILEDIDNFDRNTIKEKSESFFFILRNEPLTINKIL